MSGPNVCKWCGAKWTEKVYHSYMSAYPCGSWHDGAGQWSQGIACRDRCEQVRLQHERTIEILKAREANTVEALRGHIEDLQRRIADAVAALTAIERHEAGSDLGFEKISDHGEWVLFEDLQPVRDILQGNSPKESEDEQ